MTTKLLLTSLAVSAGLAATATAAHAEGTKLGAQVQIVPSSELEGEDLSIDLATAYALAGTVDFVVHPNIDIGLAPRIVLGLKPDGYDGDESISQYDFAARATLHGKVAPSVELFAFVSPGYSFLVSSDDDDDGPSGLILGLGGGLAAAVTPTLSLVGEVGHTFGFHEVEDNRVATNLWHLGFGIKAAL